MAINIFPTETPVGEYRSNPSDYLREYQWAHYTHAVKQSRAYGHLLSGGAVSAGSGLSVSVAAGSWLCYGRFVEFTTATTVSGLDDTPGQWNYIFLQLTFAANLVTTASFVSNTTGTPPSYSVCVGRVWCESGATGTIEQVGAAGYAVGSYSGGTGGSTERLVFVGFEPYEIILIKTGISPIFAIGGSGANGITLWDGGSEAGISSDVAPASAPLGFLVKGRLNDGSWSYRCKG